MGESILGSVSIVCLGEALVDLIGEPAGEEPRSYEIHSGGALANVAVAAARAGAPAALAGGSGEDVFGNLLRRRLQSEGVSLEHMHVLPELVTPFAFVHRDADGEPSYSIHGDAIEAGLAALAGAEAALVEDADALMIGSNTLSADPGLTVTREAVREAAAAGVPVLFDPNLRPGRWRKLGHALDLCREIAADCFLLKSNLAEARLLLSDSELEAPEAAAALCELGPELAVVTAGARPAVARGGAEAECPPIPVEDPQPVGAGDAFMGTLAAHMHAAAFSPPAVSTALPKAVAAGAEACGRTGAID